MPELDRRRLLEYAIAGVTVTGTTAAAGGSGTAHAATAEDTTSSKGTTSAGHSTRAPIVVTPQDGRYDDMTTGYNKRWVGRPEQIRVIRSTADAVAAVQEAVTDGKRLSVRSGGGCFEDFVYNPEIETVLDLSTLDKVFYDESRRAFCVEPGAILLNVYDTLYRGWGVTLPGGLCYSVGMGGHACGGGYGLLSRQFGLVVDHLHAVEVVVVDAAGRARAVVATNDPNDPHHDLWWAHTGGGGGNFGVVTRYWFRSPDATGTDPDTLLPAPPSHVLLNIVAIPWSSVDEADFGRLLRNFCAWQQAHSAPGAPENALSSLFGLNHIAAGVLTLITQVDADAPDAEAILADHLTAIGAGTAQAVRDSLAAAPTKVTWGQATRFISTSNYAAPAVRVKARSAYLKGNFTTEQASVIHRHLTSSDYSNPGASLILFPYGGEIGTVASDATAIPQRDSFVKMQYQAWWVDPATDDQHISWVRSMYREVYADTGGVPVPDGTWDGCYINYVDADMADPAQNTSGVPWSTFYYKDNYPRLQRAKAAYDPRNVFRHALSIEPPEGE
ncbi:MULTISPECIES: FAD-dependent oxidoreductase [Streptomyces]|uniref:Aclacinomycin-N/aclacinomycin-A oxidase n=1 Tax=Streptomyces griseorubiginosus TaxID=67304 RepID=A0AAI8KUP6_9ACTN|nr:BBE domain-containing protein [Streptomyces griseorubiginosus]AYC36330.1 Aclacinomycin-N/aclacinomycin-A oxidase [Streptomyces griseorubiginosus]